MKLIYIVSYLLLILPDASLASEIQQITFTYANVSSHSCVEERSEVLRRISLRSDTELSSALCSFENSDESELIIKFRWKDLASPVYSSALGLLAGGSDGDNPVLPDFFNVYYGAFSNRE